MFSPPKTIKSTFLLIAGFCIISSISKAQETTEYFRHFELSFDSSVNTDRTLDTNVFADFPFEVKSRCPQDHTIVIAVSADYPKRIPQIEEEIKLCLKNEFPLDKLNSINILKATDLQSYCQ